MITHLAPVQMISYVLSDEGLLTLTLASGRTNLITLPFINDLVCILTWVNTNPRVKVVLIKGNGSYFCSGADENILKNIVTQQSIFSDYSLFEALLYCPVPLIMAMDGHAIGGGFTLGCYGDFMLLSEESRYSANFVQHGFTPGVGSTYLFFEWFDKPLANELLYTGNIFSGSELKQRQPSLIVKKKTELIAEALSMATSLLSQPSYLLRENKKLLCQRRCDAIPQVIDYELASHKQCFANINLDE